ncbi:MAG: hypothetical protein ACM3UQ_00030 [Clostridiales bacterium]
MEKNFRTRVNSGRTIFALVFATVLLTSLVVSVREAHAMGQAPSTCNNRYDGTISSMKVTVGQKTYDPIAHPGVTIHLRNDRSYTVTFTIHMPSQSSQNNTLGGSTWYDTSAPGYQMGTCINGVGPNQDITRTLSESHPANLAPQATQTVSWKTLMSSEITYNINWVNP